jgi:tetratricopeptide (TPR) repeat protein
VAARNHLEAAVALGPENPAAHTALADLVRQTGDAEGSLKHYHRAIALDPNLERPRLGEAQALHALGRFVELREHLEDARRLFPDSGLVAYALAWTLSTSPDPADRDPETALDLAERVFSSRSAIENAVLVAAALAAADRCAEAASFLRELEAAAEKVEGGETPAAYLAARIEYLERGSPCVLPPSGRVD